MLAKGQALCKKSKLLIRLPTKFSPCFFNEKKGEKISGNNPRTGNGNSMQEQMAKEESRVAAIKVKTGTVVETDEQSSLKRPDR